MAADCKHCNGTGKCNCGSCWHEAEQVGVQRSKDPVLAVVGTVACATCGGTGNERA